MPEPAVLTVKAKVGVKAADTDTGLAGTTKLQDELVAGVPLHASPQLVRMAFAPEDSLIVTVAPWGNVTLQPEVEPDVQLI